MANNILELFRQILRQNPYNNVEKVLNDLLKLSSKLTKQYNKMVSMVGTESNVFEIIHRRVKEFNYEDTKLDQKSINTNQASITTKSTNNVNANRASTNKQQAILYEEPKILFRKQHKYNKDLNKLILKNTPYQQFLEDIQDPRRLALTAPNSNLKVNKNRQKLKHLENNQNLTHTPLIVSNLKSSLNSKIQEKGEKKLKATELFKTHFIVELQGAINENVVKINEVMQLLIKQLEEIIQTLYYKQMIMNDFANNLPTLSGPSSSTKQEAFLNDDANELEIGNNLIKHASYQTECLNNKARESIEIKQYYNTDVISTNVLSIYLNNFITKDHTNHYNEFLRDLIEKKLSHMINTLDMVQFSKSKAELLARNTEILRNTINSDNNNLIKLIYLKQKVNTFTNHVRFLNVLNFAEIYTIVKAIEQINTLNLQYTKSGEANVELEQEKGAFLEKLKMKLADMKSIIKYDMLDVNMFNLLNVQDYKTQLSQHETAITNTTKENSEFLKKTLISMDPFESFILQSNDLVLLSCIVENSFRRFQDVEKINFRLRQLNDNINHYLKQTRDNDPCFQRILPTTDNINKVLVKKKFRLEEKEKKHIVIDGIKEWMEVFEINRKAFNETEKKLKIMEILNRLKEKRRQKEADIPTESEKRDTSALEMQIAPFKSINSSLLRNNKVFSKKLYNILKEAIEGISMRQYIQENITIINNLKFKSRMLFNSKSNMQTLNEHKKQQLIKFKEYPEKENAHKPKINKFQHTDSNPSQIIHTETLNKCTTLSSIRQSGKTVNSWSSFYSKVLEKKITKNKKDAYFHSNTIINVLIPIFTDFINILQNIGPSQKPNSNSLCMQHLKIPKTPNQTEATKIVPFNNSKIQKPINSIKNKMTASNLENSKNVSKEEQEAIRNIHNQPPFYFKQHSKKLILPKSTMWSTCVKPSIHIHRNNSIKQNKPQFCFTKKYRYETKEVPSLRGEKIKITCLIGDE